MCDAFGHETAAFMSRIIIIISLVKDEFYTKAAKEFCGKAMKKKNKKRGDFIAHSKKHTESLGFLSGFGSN